MTRCYIAGPMSNLPDLNFPAFHAAAAALRAVGLDVVSPAEVNPDPTMTWGEAMRRDIPHLLTCDMVVLLPGWTRSKGARIEMHLAVGLGLTVMPLKKALKNFSTAASAATT